MFVCRDRLLKHLNKDTPTHIYIYIHTHIEGVSPRTFPPCNLQTTPLIGVLRHATTHECSIQVSKKKKKKKRSVHDSWGHNTVRRYDRDDGGIPAQGTTKYECSRCGHTRGLRSRESHLDRIVVTTSGRQDVGWGHVAEQMLRTRRRAESEQQPSALDIGELHDFPKLRSATADRHAACSPAWLDTVPATRAFSPQIATNLLQWFNCSRLPRSSFGCPKPRHPAHAGCPRPAGHRVQGWQRYDRPRR